MNNPTYLEIQRLTQKINEAEETSSTFIVEANTLRTQREHLIAKMIIDDQMLANTHWEIKVGTTQAAHLDYLAGPDDNSMAAIRKLVDPDYHSWFEITEGVTIEFDDGDVKLSFKEAKQILPFVNKFKLHLQGGSLTDRLAKLKREVVALEKICHQFKL